MFFVSATLCSVGGEPANFSEELESKQALLQKGKKLLLTKQKYILVDGKLLKNPNYIDIKKLD